jgi:CheY-like chemotaxis protein
MIEIELHAGRDLWEIHADPIQIEQILLNLSSNAADAMPDGGKLLIETENVVLDEDYARNHLNAEPGRYVLLAVTDTGHGIEKDIMDKIFDPFFTTKQLGKGTGLGLASVYGIVKGHDGYISCYSEKEQGTTFKVYLPATEAVHLNESPDIEEPVTGGTESILIVDDEEWIRDFASKILTEHGYGVSMASSGEEAIKSYSGKDTEIDLVILDIGMPGMGGYKCLSEIINFDPSAKVIIASGYLINAQPANLLEAGAAGYIGKPYQVSELLKKVRTLLDGEV